MWYLYNLPPQNPTQVAQPFPHPEQRLDVGVRVICEPWPAQEEAETATVSTTRKTTLSATAHLRRLRAELATAALALGDGQALR